MCNSVREFSEKYGVEEHDQVTYSGGTRTNTVDGNEVRYTDGDKVELVEVRVFNKTLLVKKDNDSEGIVVKFGDVEEVN